MSRSPRVDAYIAGAAPFAKPILRRLRSAFHKACPRVEESLKWGVPHFGYRGNLGLMAAFKKHASFGFWRHRELPDPGDVFRGNPGMGGVRYTDLSQVPSEAVLRSFVKAAVKLNKAGPATRPKRKPKPPARVPPDFRAALKKKPGAPAVFDAWPPGKRREYVDWIVEAKRPETRAQRIATAATWIALGRALNWKYGR